MGVTGGHCLRLMFRHPRWRPGSPHPSPLPEGEGEEGGDWSGWIGTVVQVAELVRGDIEGIGSEIRFAVEAGAVDGGNEFRDDGVECLTEVGLFSDLLLKLRRLLIRGK